MQNTIQIILFLAIIATCYTQQLQHVTASTNCTIIFDSNPDNMSDPGMKFQKCVRNTCMRNLINGNCANLQTFQFTQEKCYWQCCHLQSFDFIKCQEYNRNRQIVEKSADYKLSLVLIIVFFGLIIAVIIFSVYYLNCCENFDRLRVVALKEDQFQWKQCRFNQEQECEICYDAGAFIMASCGKFYHLKCINTIQNWTCVDCNKPLKKMKLFCPICQTRSIVLQAQNFDQLDRKIIELYQFHPEKCLEDMDNQMDTQRKFTQTTKQ